MFEVEVFVCIDTDGQSGVGDSEDAAKADYGENGYDLADCNGFRIIKVILSIPEPEPLEAALEATAWPNPPVQAEQPYEQTDAYEGNEDS